MSYYTPEKSEFCLDFEYEVLEKAPDLNKDGIKWLTTFPVNTEDEWLKHKFPDPFLGYHLDKMFKTYEMRVRQLDKADIESLGYEVQQDSKDWLIMKGGKIEGVDSYIELCKATNEITIDNFEEFDGNITWFKGTIKNKSELIKILKQVG